MNAVAFIKALWPLWATELVLSGLYHAFGPEEVTTLSTISMVISSVLLPFIAGFFIVSYGGGIGLSILGGISISAATILVVVISYLIISAGFTAFFGFILATLMFSVAPQAFFGAMGGLVGRKVYAKAT